MHVEKYNTDSMTKMGDFTRKDMMSPTTQKSCVGKRHFNDRLRVSDSWNVMKHRNKTLVYVEQ